MANSNKTKIKKISFTLFFNILFHKKVLLLYSNHTNEKDTNGCGNADPCFLGLQQQ